MKGITVAVYGSSSSEIAPTFAAAAFELGALLARAGMGVVCGGGRAGLMQAVTDGALSCGGHVAGVLPAFMMERNWNHPSLTETVVTDSMHSRKAEMLRRAGAVVALPGGIGTFDELFEAMTWQQLGLWSGPIVILNTDGYYDPIVEQLAQSTAKGFMRRGCNVNVTVASTPAEAAALVAPEG